MLSCRVTPNITFPIPSGPGSCRTRRQNSFHSYKRREHLMCLRAFLLVSAASLLPAGNRGSSISVPLCCACMPAVSYSSLKLFAGAIDSRVACQETLPLREANLLRALLCVQICALRVSSALSVSPGRQSVFATSSIARAGSELHFLRAKVSLWSRTICQQLAQLQRAHRSIEGG